MFFSTMQNFLNSHTLLSSCALRVLCDLATFVLPQKPGQLAVHKGEQGVQRSCKRTKTNFPKFFTCECFFFTGRCKKYFTLTCKHLWTTSIGKFLDCDEHTIDKNANETRDCETSSRDWAHNPTVVTFLKRSVTISVVVSREFCKPSEQKDQ